MPRAHSLDPERFFFNRPETTESMAAIAKAKQLVLFIGAGVPASQGLPTWTELLERLLHKCAEKDVALKSDRLRNEYVAFALNTYDATQLGSIIRNAYPDDEVLADLLRTELYYERQTFLPDAASANFVRSVCQFILTRRLNRLNTLVVTTNYDDVLERSLNHSTLRALRHRAGITKLDPRVSLAPRSIPSDTIRIHHIHGYVPKEPSQQISPPNIVISGRDYGASWTDHWSFVQLDGFWDAEWLFVGASFADPHLTFFAVQRERHKTQQSARPKEKTPMPTAVFCLQARGWGETEAQTKEALKGAEESRLAEVGVRALPTDFFFQDAQFLREVCLLMGRRVKRNLSYKYRLDRWHRELSEGRLSSDGEPTRKLYLEQVSDLLREIRQSVEQLALDPRDRPAETSGRALGSERGERFKCELWCRDVPDYSLFQVGSSEHVPHDPARGRRFYFGDEAAAIATFINGQPVCIEAPHLQHLGRWKSFFGAPVVLGANRWYDLPVGALVIASTAAHMDSSLIANQEAVRRRVDKWLAPMTVALDPRAKFPPPSDRGLITELTEGVKRTKSGQRSTRNAKRKP